MSLVWVIFVWSGSLPVPIYGVLGSTVSSVMLHRWVWAPDFQGYGNGSLVLVRLDWQNKLAFAFLPFPLPAPRIWLQLNLWGIPEAFRLGQSWPAWVICVGLTLSAGVLFPLLVSSGSFSSQCIPWEYGIMKYLSLLNWKWNGLEWSVYDSTLGRPIECAGIVLPSTPPHWLGWVGFLVRWHSIPGIVLLRHFPKFNFILTFSNVINVSFTSSINLLSSELFMTMSSMYTSMFLPICLAKMDSTRHW